MALMTTTTVLAVVVIAALQTSGYINPGHLLLTSALALVFYKCRCPMGSEDNTGGGSKAPTASSGASTSASPTTPFSAPASSTSSAEPSRSSAREDYYKTRTIKPNTPLRSVRPTAGAAPTPSAAIPVTSSPTARATTVPCPNVVTINLPSRPIEPSPLLQQAHYSPSSFHAVIGGLLHYFRESTPGRLVDYRQEMREMGISDCLVEKIMDQVTRGPTVELPDRRFRRGF